MLSTIRNGLFRLLSADRRAANRCRPAVHPSRSEPNFGAGQNRTSVDALRVIAPVSPHRPMIGTSEQTNGQTDQGPVVSATPMIGTTHGRGHAYADGFAAAFLSWFAPMTNVTPMLSAEAVISIAAKNFAPMSGMPMPPARNLLGALKRAPGVRVKRDVRIRDARGDVVGKTTVYMLPSTATPTETVQRAA